MIIPGYTCFSAIPGGTLGHIPLVEIETKVNNSNEEKDKDRQDDSHLDDGATFFV
ncbi:MAG: hypothetical protein PF442_11145 [Desulfobulbaceae bacterium]|nr:hypothetical protein [Desulfobulbaceae bacterium]